MTDIRSEPLLVAAGQAVMTAFHMLLEQDALPVPAIAALRKLQMALEAYGPVLQTGRGPTDLVLIVETEALLRLHWDEATESRSDS